MPETILIVDDEPAQLKMAQTAIHDKLHYRAVTATGSQEAIAWVTTGRDPKPDLMLLDLMMPGVGGLEVIRTVKVCRPSLPVIVLTSYGDNQTAASAVQAGAQDYLDKPVCIERLGLSIRNAIAMQRMASTIEQFKRSSPMLVSEGNTSWCLDEQGRLKKLKRLEEEAIRFALQHTQWCMTRTARCLGIGRSTLYRKISDLGIEDHISRANHTARPMIYISSGKRS